MFEAFRDPDTWPAGGGRRDVTNTFHEFDFWPGGTRRFVMHAPDGASYQNRSVFVELVAPERIVFDHVSGPTFRMTVTLAEQAGATRIGWRMLFESASDATVSRNSPWRPTSRTSTAWKPSWRGWPDARRAHRWAATW